ncbi:MAG TPA: 50S ribosomal protein L24 [Egibacteraceae bacterium]|nr:50S ribosomal protein L24 [Actinomycetota bacterium]HWB71783.1 50S ribosomal protein L24 [Egibacteraceae bacterium]
MQRVRRNDTVRVISGKDAGKEGRVVRVYPRQERVLVEGINRVTKHQRMRTTRAGAQEGGLVHEEAPIHVSNVMPVCPSCGAPARVGARFVGGQKTRFCRRCDGEF